MPRDCQCVVVSDNSVEAPALLPLCGNAAQRANTDRIVTISAWLGLVDE